MKRRHMNHASVGAWQGTYGRDGPSDKAEDADTGTHGSVERHDEEGAPSACRRDAPMYTRKVDFFRYTNS